MLIKTPHTTLDLNSRVHVMGILNVTPDSFSDGGRLTSQTDLLNQAETMIQDGADILDIGGESSRPFAEEVATEEELHRVIPAITAIRKRFSTPISIDTTKAEVARQALEAGADIINDISAFQSDPGIVDIALQYDVPVIIMHMQGTPRTMQVNPSYDDVIGEIRSALAERIDWAEERGLSRNKIIVDPGIGFGKTIGHNLTILKNLSQFSQLGCPILVGHSRKAFIGSLLDIKDPTSRDDATSVLSALCVQSGVSILRVHDVGKTIQAVKLAEAVLKAVDN
ncbi:MAG: dihydropteroate synthase [Desulfobulbaceae bacterium]|uniref:Dihydropteroate synthase n=1 Tax=Candidatus Desulfobia pelagia TaxID=2841692 RepID=A0A8J6NGP2_9BACT|nr:dihydropteroate synthase [Candidatus Desulfobia pelagia]